MYTNNSAIIKCHLNLIVMFDPTRTRVLYNSTEVCMRCKTIGALINECNIISKGIISVFIVTVRMVCLVVIMGTTFGECRAAAAVFRDHCQLEITILHILPPLV